jgi:hypothetical protein
MEFTNFKRELQTLNYAELNYLISDIMLEIKKRSYNEGMVKAMTTFGSSTEEVAPTKSPQQLRDEIVKKAKRDVTDLIGGLIIGDYYVNFVVNREKRTTVALLRYAKKYGVHKRGIAKCDPTDCFNTHIGEAISLRRALGLEVPTEYLTAPQPTEVRVGDVVKWEHVDYYYEVTSLENKWPNVLGFKADGTRFEANGGNFYHHGIKITDDSREEVTE